MIAVLSEAPALEQGEGKDLPTFVVLSEAKDLLSRTDPRRIVNQLNKAVAPLVACLVVLLSMACERAPAAKPAASVASVAPATTGPLDYTPPPDSLVPHDEMGTAIRRGLALITRTTDSLPAYAPGNIQCVSCHIDGGRRRDAAGLMGVFSRYPKYLERSGAVVPIEDRINYCFTRSLGGNKLPSDSREMQDIVAYLAYISTGVPVGRHVLGESMPKMPKLTGDTTRGAALFATTCVACHGAEGQGTPPAFPALWGSKSFSIGASMAREERAASFIRHFMPQNKPGSLTDQQAYDVAAYVDSHLRPDSPGKRDDWPKGGAPADTPYDTKGHTAYRPPAGTMFPRANPSAGIVPAPASVMKTSAAASVRAPSGGDR